MSPQSLNAARLGYWYLRLNGFLMIESFILHDERYGTQRTDIDLMAIRFPYRREALEVQNSEEKWMLDDGAFAQVKKPLAALVEIKAGPCKLNGPWTDPTKGNMARALRAFGLLANGEVELAAAALYQIGSHTTELYQLRLIALGSKADPELATKMAGILQITWDETKRFIFRRFTAYGHIKRFHDQWDDTGKQLMTSFYASKTEEDFLRSVVVS